MNRYEYLKYKSNLDLIPSLNSLIMVLIMGYLTISNYKWHHLETIIDTLSEILFRGNPPVRFLLWFDQLSTFLCNLLSRTVPRCNSPGNPSFETSGSQGPWRSEQSGPSHFKSTTAPIVKFVIVENRQFFAHFLANWFSWLSINYFNNGTLKNLNVYPGTWSVKIGTVNETDSIRNHLEFG